MNTGRRRKDGKRFPGGKLRPTEPISGAEWQQLKEDARRLRLDARLFSELGRLNWFGEFTATQTAAGQQVAAVYGRYEGFHGLIRSARSPAYQAARGQIKSNEETLDPKQLKELQRLQRATDTDMRDIRKATPFRFLAALEALCVEDRSVNPTSYPQLRTALERLAKLWGVNAPTGHSPETHHARAI